MFADHCDGTFDQYCSPGREVTNITEILQFHGETRILDWMGKYWKDNTGHDETFWEHEFNKRAYISHLMKPQLTFWADVQMEPASQPSNPSAFKTSRIVTMS